MIATFWPLCFGEKLIILPLLSLSFAPPNVSELGRIFADTVSPFRRPNPRPNVGLRASPFLIPYPPWCWNIYLHLPQKSPSFVGKYSSTMVS